MHWKLVSTVSEHCFSSNNQANLIKQEARLKIASTELQDVQKTLDEKQAELNVVQAKYDGAMAKKKVSAL